jgi:hypothetical protein
MAATSELAGYIDLTKYLTSDSHYRPRTNPKHPFDYTLWYALRPLMHAFAGGKKTHWWQWKKLPFPEHLQPEGSVTVPGDPQVFRIDESNWYSIRRDRIRMSLGGWPNAVIIGPDYTRIDPAQVERGWRALYRMPTHPDVADLCTAISNDKFKILRGPDNTQFYGVGAYDMSQVPLKIVATLHRDMKTPDTI